MKIHAFRLTKGMDLKKSIEQYVVDKEIKSGKEGEIDAKDAQKLSKLGFVKIIGTDKGQTNGSTSGKGSQ